MPEQLSLFADRSSGPEGLRYAEEFVSPAVEKALIGHIAGLPLQPFQFGQYEGKRRVASFGFRYDYTLRRLEEADPLPDPAKRDLYLCHVPKSDQMGAFFRCR